MQISSHQDSIVRRIQGMTDRTTGLKNNQLYYYNQPVQEILSDSRVRVNGRVMSMYASYGYLGLLGHPRINAAAKEAVDRYGTGTHGVRTLAGSLTLHQELEETIANFKHAEEAVTFSSGYVTNFSVISTLVSRGDTVFCDKLNHASIYDGCMMSHSRFERFNHNDLNELETLLQNTPAESARLVVVDAVFSMDGDLVDLPALAAICEKYHAWLMVDEAHSVGVLGKTGRGIEEHYGLDNVIDIKMGTLSKTIPSVGGYVTGKHEMISYLRHAARGYIFSAALPPAQAAAANEAFKVILDEPWRMEKLNENSNRFISGLKSAGLDTMLTTTAIVPVLCGDDETAFRMTRAAQEQDIFVLPVVSPAVPNGLARLRATVTAAHELDDIDRTVAVIAESAHRIGLLQ
jgi:glycine C-acetyltransferase